MRTTENFDRLGLSSKMNHTGSHIMVPLIILINLRYSFVPLDTSYNNYSVRFCNTISNIGKKKSRLFDEYLLVPPTQINPFSKIKQLYPIGGYMTRMKLNRLKSFPTYCCGLRTTR